MVVSLLKFSRQVIYPLFELENTKDCWKINMRQYLDEEGCLDPCITKSAAIMARYFGQIVLTATKDGTFGPIFSEIDCRRRPNGDPCKGRLEIIYVDYLQNFQIYWRCPTCRDKGIIYGWENSCWDLMATEPHPDPYWTTNR